MKANNFITLFTFVANRIVCIGLEVRQSFTGERVNREILCRFFESIQVLKFKCYIGMYSKATKTFDGLSSF